MYIPMSIDKSYLIYKLDREQNVILNVILLPLAHVSYDSATSFLEHIIVMFFLGF